MCIIRWVYKDLVKLYTQLSHSVIVSLMNNCKINILNVHLEVPDNLFD